MSIRISAATGLGLMLCALNASAVDVGEPAPAFQLPAANSPSTALADFTGKVVLVNFWATWCGPCREEIPALMKMRAELGNQGFEVIGINIDKEREKAAQFAQRLAIDYPVVFDERQDVINQYKVKSMPTSYLVDRDGTVRQVFYGYTAKKRAGMETAITNLVRRTPVAQAQR